MNNNDAFKREPIYARQLGLQAAVKIPPKQPSSHGPSIDLTNLYIVIWAAGVPALLSVTLGLLIDQIRVSGNQWTVALTVVGVVVGYLNARGRLAREARMAQEERDDVDD